MNCKTFLDVLDEYLDGKMEPAQQMAMQRHMQDCPECRALYEQTAEIMSGCAEIGLSDRAPEGFKESVMEKIAQETPVQKKKTGKRWLKIGGGIAAGLAVVVLGTAAFASVFSANGKSYAAAAKPQMAAAEAPAAYYAASTTSAANDMAYYEEGAAMGYADYAPAEPMEEPVPAPSLETASVAGGTDTKISESAKEYERKIIVNGDIEIQTSNFDADLAQILATVERVGGYVSSSSTSGQPIKDTGARQGRNAYYSVRIPAKSYSELVDLTRGCGKVTYYNEYSDDITSNYYDVQTRLETYQTQYDKVTELLEKCDKMEDILEIETHLTDLLYKIDSLKGQLRMWDQLVSFSTLNISINEVADPASIPAKEDPTVIERIRSGFYGGVNDLVEGAQDFVVWLASNVFTLIIWAIILIAVWLIIRGIIRKRKNR